MDFFTINNTPFVYVTGTGQFLHISYTTTKEDKEKLGHLAYIKDGKPKCPYSRIIVRRIQK